MTEQYTLKILVACEFSGVVREAFARHGHDAWSCDLLPTEIPSDHHIQDDVLKHLDDGWDLMVAHPPCTFLCNSGVRWLHERPERYQEMVKAYEFFNNLLDAPVDMIAVENPIQHKYARRYIRKYDQIVQPWMFGDNESKATCLWLVNLPELTPTHTKPAIIKQSIWRLPPSPERKTNRSRTFKGIAEAMATQWGKL